MKGTPSLPLPPWNQKKLRRKEKKQISHHHNQEEKKTNKKKFSSVPWLTGSSGGDTRDDSAEIFFQSFLRRPLWAVLAQAWNGPTGMGTECPFFNDVHPVFLLLTTVSLDRCQKRFLWTHKEVDLALHPVIVLVFEVGDTEMFPWVLSFESLDPFLQGQQAESMFCSYRGGWRWWETCRALTCLRSWWCCTARFRFIWPLLPLLRQSWCGLLLSRLPSLHRIAHRYLKLVTHSNFWLLLIYLHWCWSCFGHDLAFFCADFHSICHCSVNESVDEVLKFTIAVACEIGVVGKSWIAYWPPTNGDGCMVVMECFLHDFLVEQVE